ncbi:restriction endonuclease subunit S [Streptomyces nanshensis]|uniref:Restriction endonuclease subunit S n=1 Tax=Streptomyces nanshensis TaxID=518642 RepID=A0A1E7LI15_9ACTN|nr:restriction endonuclease subunit S [Streptomyces nanshensis]
MTEWRETTLDQLVKLQRGHDLPTSQRRAGSVPVMGAAGQSGTHDTEMAKAPGVVLGRAGASMGKATYCDVDFWPLNTALYVTDFQGNDPRFTYYLLDRIDFSGYNSGAAQPMLNRNYITQIPISLPEPAEQRAISAVAGSLDDKIAVNERIAAAARELGLALYSQSLYDGDSAEVAVESFTTAVTRGIAPKYTDSSDELTVLNQKCIRDGRVTLEPARLTLREKVKAPKLLQRNDVLVNSTGVGTLGRVARWTLDMDATVDSHITIVRFNEDKVDPVCAGFAMLRAQPEIEAMGEGSTGQTELRRSQVGELELTLPGSAGQKELRPKLDALEERADQALRESLALADLRDTLLPQLMSGSLRVRDAEKIVEDAV